MFKKNYLINGEELKLRVLTNIITHIILNILSYLDMCGFIKF
jgi:hypothetical protein